jgi:hypothetical protein
LDDQSRPIAETYRRAGELAAALGLVRPSYEQIRVLLHDDRRHRRARAERREVMWQVYVGRRSPRALFDPGPAD